MKILILGNGGREHAIGKKLLASDARPELYFIKGNGGTEKIGTNVDIDIMDFKSIVSFAKEESMDLVVIGPEDPLCYGLSDELRAEGIEVFGVDRECAQFEKSKHFTKEFLQKYDIPTANYGRFTDFDRALEFLKTQSLPTVIKADGLCLGKGVFIVHTLEEGEEVLKEIFVDRIFDDQGDTVVIEDFLAGEEMSLICFVSNNKIFPMETARDYKKIGEGDTGDNTGGVGCFSPGRKISDENQVAIDAIVEKISAGFEAEGLEYTGILFIGFMIDAEGPKVLEFNVRFGDPETEVLLPRLESDLVEIIQKTNNHTLTGVDLGCRRLIEKKIVMTSDGYPATSTKGKLIESLPEDREDTYIIHSGTKLEDGKLTTNGGRVLVVIGEGDTLEEARTKAYDYVKQVKCDYLNYRRDIGLA